jgi:uncharacterized protein
MKRPHAAGIPRYASATKAVATRQRYVGTLPLAQMPRLAAQLAGNAGQLDVELEAGPDAAGRPALRGAIRGELSLACQRGLHPFPWPCQVDTALRLVGSEAEEEKAMGEADTHLVVDDQLPLRDIVEDEVLLALPMMPRCDDPDCLKRLK